MTRHTSTTSQQPRVLSPSPQRPSCEPLPNRYPQQPPRVDRDSPGSEQQPDSQHHPESHPDSDSQRQPPSSTSSKRRRPATTPNPSQASRKRKATELQNEISSQVHRYLSETDPSLWSLEHLKTVIGKKYPAKQKWYLQTQLEEICRTSLPGSSEAGAARRVLRVLNPRKPYQSQGWSRDMMLITRKVFSLAVVEPIVLALESRSGRSPHQPFLDFIALGTSSSETGGSSLAVSEPRMVLGMKLITRKVLLLAVVEPNELAPEGMRRKDFSVPMATFSITANAPSASTVIYAQQSTINTSSVLAPPPTEVPNISSTAAAGSGHNCEDGPAAFDTTPTRGGPATPTRGNTPSHPLTGSPSLSQSSQVDYGPYEIVDFLYIYPKLRTKFPLRTDTRDTTLEDLLRNYLLDPGNASLVKENILLQAGFIDIASRPPQLLSSKEYAIVKAALRSNSDSHIVAHCVEKCFSSCSSYASFIDARNMFSCRECKYNPLFQQATSAVIHTVHFLLNTAILSPLPLEGNFDVLWSSIIDHAFISPYGVLHRKEKTSPLSPDKFDGLYIGGRVEPQEWLVIEVARSSGQGLKQTLDRQKLIEHCLRILTYRRWYLGTRTDLRGKELIWWLSRFPMWGVLCQGLGIEIVRFSWLSKGVGVVTTFASRFPEHTMRLESLWRILEEVHVAALEVKGCVREWDELHGGMVGNRIT